MKSALLLSILFMTFAMPVIAARDPRATSGLRKMIIAFAVFVLAYYFWVSYGHTRFFVPRR